MFLKAKTYHFYKQKTLYRRNTYFLVDKIRIECIGGDSMSEENELVFLEPEDIPNFRRGMKSSILPKIFDKIPNGKVLAMDTETYGSAPNIRLQAKNYNKSKRKEVLKVSQRTDKKTEKVTVYVTRL